MFQPSSRNIRVFSSPKTIRQMGRRVTCYYPGFSFKNFFFFFIRSSHRLHPSVTLRPHRAVYVKREFFFFPPGYTRIASIAARFPNVRSGHTNTRAISVSTHYRFGPEHVLFGSAHLLMASRRKLLSSLNAHRVLWVIPPFCTRFFFFFLSNENQRSKSTFIARAF